MSAALPPYSYSASPSYSTLPCENEDTVDFTPRARRLEAHTFLEAGVGNITKKWRDVTIVFKNQDDSDTPTYGRNATVCGEIDLEKTENILFISLKLEGRISLSSSHTGSITQKIVDERRALWDHSKSGPCPSVVGFAVGFPAVYKDQNKHWRLPPSYETICLGSPLLVVKCAYRLSITITKTRNRRLAFWKSTSKTYTTHLFFRPRNRPARPILEDPSFFSTLKAAPSEWLQTVITIPPRQRATVEPITCNFVIPSVQTFCLSELIPFHIQLCGSRNSLRHFYGPVLSEPTLPAEKKPRRRQFAAIIRVFLARQIYVEVNGRQSWRTITVGEGTLRPIPPVASHLEGDSAEVSVDWDGEVRCRGDVTCASFSISHLVVKDFIILAMTPANVRTSPLLPIQHAHPIRLVTDGWTDQELLHPQDR